MAKMIDLTGQKFGRLSVVEIHSINEKRVVKWFCVCDCGKTTATTSWRLRTGEVKSCGCLNGELARKRWLKHGQTSKNENTPEYNTWSGIKERCFNKNVDSYHFY